MPSAQLSHSLDPSHHLHPEANRAATPPVPVSAEVLRKRSKACMWALTSRCMTLTATMVPCLLTPMSSAYCSKSGSRKPAAISTTDSTTSSFKQHSAQACARAMLVAQLPRQQPGSLTLHVSLSSACWRCAPRLGIRVASGCVRGKGVGFQVWYLENKETTQLPIINASRRVMNASKQNTESVQCLELNESQETRNRGRSGHSNRVQE